MPRQLVLLTLILALELACKSGGSGPTTPIEPTYQLLHLQPCLVEQPVDPGSILRRTPKCEVVDDELDCPPLTDQQVNALWAYVEAIEDTAWRAWRCAERQRAEQR